MSDTQQGWGWWEASDGKWYPPELHSDYSPPRPPPPTTSHTPAIAASHHVEEAAAVPEVVTRSGPRWPSLGGWLVIAVFGLYIVSPIDFFPELLLGPFGYADDVIAFLPILTVMRSSFRGRKSRH